MRAVKNTASNSQQLTKVPGLVTSLKDLVADSFSEIKAASEELQENQGKSEEIKTKCQEKKADDPKDCYLLCGKPIEVTPEKEKAWKEAKKR